MGTSYVLQVFGHQPKCFNPKISIQITLKAANVDLMVVLDEKSGYRQNVLYSLSWHEYWLYQIVSQYVK